MNISDMLSVLKMTEEVVKFLNNIGTNIHKYVYIRIISLKIKIVTWHEKTVLMCTQNLSTFLDFEFL